MNNKNKYSLSFVEDLDSHFMELTFRQLDKTPSIKYYIDSKEKELADLIAIVYTILKKTMIIIHFALNFNNQLLNSLNEILDECIKGAKIAKNPFYNKELE